MRIQVCFSGQDHTADDGARVERQLRFKLTRFERYLQRVEVSIDMCRVGSARPECVVGICRRASKSDVGHVAGIEFIRAYDLPDHLNDTQVKGLPACVRRFSDLIQERLSRHLFDRQIELRNKGLL